MAGSTSSRNVSEAGASSEPPVIGVVCALHLEITDFLNRCRQRQTESGNGFKFRGCQRGETRICVVEGGTGYQRAKQATHALIDAFNPKWVLSVGFSGGLIDSLGVGDIVVGNAVCIQNGEKRLSIDVKMNEDPQQGLYVGPLYTSEQIIREVQQKRDLAKQTGAIAVDMESFAVAKVCSERKTRFMAIRAISDDLTSDLPPEVLALLGPTGTIRAGALFGSILKRPSSVKDLWAMREQAVKASERLGKYLAALIDQLGDQQIREMKS